jgi:hypothetical protein
MFAQYGLLFNSLRSTVWELGSVVSSIAVSTDNGIQNQATTIDNTATTASPYSFETNLFRRVKQPPQLPMHQPPTAEYPDSPTTIIAVVGANLETAAAVPSIMHGAY